MNSRLLLGLFALICIPDAWAHEGGPSCDSAAAKLPAIESARAELKQNSRSITVRTSLADQLIDIGCYDEAVHVLENGARLFPGDRNLATRLRTAKSFVGEREFLAKQNAVVPANTADSLRAQLRCKQFGDLQACEQALSGSPNDAALWIAKGDLLLKEKRSRDALVAFSRAKQLNAPESDLSARIVAAQTLLGVQSPPAIAN